MSAAAVMSVRGIYIELAWIEAGLLARTGPSKVSPVYAAMLRAGCPELVADQAARRLLAQGGVSR